MTSQHDASLQPVLALLQAGRTADALAGCQALIAGDSGHAPAHHLLGVLAAQAGDFHTAAGHFAQAIALDPDQPDYHRHLGLACQRLGQAVEAQRCLQRAIELNASDLVALNELGNLHWAGGRLAEALACYERVLAREPGNVAALLNLANAQARLGQSEQAVARYEQVLSLQPDSAEARFGLASALAIRGHHQRAAALFEEVARMRPDFPGLLVNLGLALMKLGRCEAAIACYDQAIARHPDDYMAHNNRGNALRGQQRMAEALASFRRALAIKPDHANAHSNLLLTLNYTAPSQAEIFEESLRFDARQAAPLCPAPPLFANSRAPQRVLRVGYVSADLRRHSVAFFLRGVLAAHDRARVQVFCYANVDRPDAVTGELRSLADQWRSIVGLPDAEVARQVTADRIDILVDLGGHTGGNRLLVFARRPAPVQVTWLGYPNTTGLRAMAYRLTDAIADPPGEADALHVERLVRLPDGFLCYQPDAALAPAPASTPDAHAGVTFASFNTLAKVTPKVIRVWSQILRRTPGSRLVLKSEALDDPDTRARFLAAFAQHGVPATRLELITWIEDYARHMACYQAVDIALDPFPYNGTTTTCEALWMGVPVITWRGSRHAARVGASLLHHAGLSQWVADSEDEYIERAVAQAAQGPAPGAVRAALSARMRSSALADPIRFTAGLERAYRELWTRWCDSPAPPPL